MNPRLEELARVKVRNDDAGFAPGRIVILLMSGRPEPERENYQERAPLCG